MNRISKENYYLNIAQTVLERATCLRRVYGAIIVKNDEILSTGYNGAPRGRVNCSQLGYARTPMVEKMAVESNPEDPESAINDIAVGVPMKRLAKPTEVGELFAFLGSDEASYLTGSQVVIDGGSTLPETMSIGTN